MTSRLLLDEHCAETIAEGLRSRGHDVVGAVSDAALRGSSDPELFLYAAVENRRIVTENIKDFRPLLLQAAAVGGPAAALVLVPPPRFPRGRGDRTAVIVTALDTWLRASVATQRSDEEWLA